VSERIPQQSVTTKTNRMTPYGQESHRKVLGSGLVRLGSWRLIFLEAFTVGFAVLSGRNSAARERSSLYLPCRSWRFLVRASHAEEHDIELTLHAQEILNRTDAITFQGSGYCCSLKSTASTRWPRYGIIVS
jgi:hypothetical protein